MAQPRLPFPRVGSWRVNASGFDPEVPQHVPQESRIEVAEGVDGWQVTVESPAGRRTTYPCRFRGEWVETAGGGIPGDGPREDFSLRRAEGAGGQEYVIGVWIRREGRGDSPIGVWVSEEDTDRPPRVSG